jgi:hypothetical protein
MERAATTAERKAPVVMLIGIGLAGGVVSGLIGVGGGIILIPLMVGLLGMSQHRAHGTSLAIIVPTACAATARYASANEIDLTIVSVALALAATSVVFAAVGARLTAHINEKLLRRLFALVLLAGALRMFVSLQDVALMNLDGGERIVAGVITGIVTGLVSGTMGVGGGIVMVPAMVIFMGIDQVIAQGISLAVIIPTALSGAFQHYRLGHVDVRRALTIGIGGLVGGFGGAQVAQVLPRVVLRALFAVFLLYSSQRMLGVQTWLTKRLRKAE